MRFELGTTQKYAKASNEAVRSQAKRYIDMTLELLGKDNADEKVRQNWIRLGHLMDVCEIDKLMMPSFDFKHYFCDYGKY